MNLLFKMFLVCLVLALSFGCARKLVPARINHSFAYLSQTAVQHDVRTEGDSLRLFLKFTDTGFFAFPQNMVVKYAVYLTHDKADIILQDSVARPASRFIKTSEALYFDFKVPVNRVKFPSVLVVQLYSARDPGNVLNHDIPLTAPLRNKTYVLLDAYTRLPLFQEFVAAEQPFFVSQAGVPVPGELILYQSGFGPALPPMASPEKNGAPSLKRLQTFSFLSDTVRLSQPGLYGLVLGGKQVGGLLVEPGTFPELTAAPDLIQPLIYLTTAEERKKLYAADNPKAAVDNFWLRIAPSQQEARHLIRTYYQRTVNANRFFSAHKPGWQTDRGMIYMIFGPPEIVNRYASHEQWTYIATGLNPEVRFVFSKKENTFTQNHFELVRSPVYEGFWYNMVEQWRKGTIEK